MAEILILAGALAAAVLLGWQWDPHRADRRRALRDMREDRPRRP